MRVLLFSTVKGVTARYQFPVEFNGDNAAGSLPVKIYADGDIKLRVDRLSGGQSLVAVNVSGASWTCRDGGGRTAQEERSVLTMAWAA
jgi:hypothetical protein